MPAAGAVAPHLEPRAVDQHLLEAQTSAPAATAPTSAACTRGQVQRFAALRGRAGARRATRRPAPSRWSARWIEPIVNCSAERLAGQLLRCADAIRRCAAESPSAASATPPATRSTAAAHRPRPRWPPCATTASGAASAALTRETRVRPFGVRAVARRTRCREAWVSGAQRRARGSAASCATQSSTPPRRCSMGSALIRDGAAARARRRCRRTAASCSASAAATPPSCALLPPGAPDAADDRPRWCRRCATAAGRCPRRCAWRASWCWSGWPCSTWNRRRRWPTSPPAMTALAEATLELALAQALAEPDAAPRRAARRAGPAHRVLDRRHGQARRARAQRVVRHRPDLRLRGRRRDRRAAAGQRARVLLAGGAAACTR